MRFLQIGFWEEVVKETLIVTSLVFGFLGLVNILFFVSLNGYVYFANIDLPETPLKCSNAEIIKNISRTHKFYREKLDYRSDFNLINSFIMGAIRLSQRNTESCQYYYTSIYPYEAGIVNFEVFDFIRPTEEALKEMLVGLDELPVSRAKLYVATWVYSNMEIKNITEEEWKQIEGIVYTLHSAQFFDDLTNQEKFYFSYMGLSMLVLNKAVFDGSCFRLDSDDATINLLASQYRESRDREGVNNQGYPHLKEIKIDEILDTRKGDCR